jgi:hypothetical protein
MSLSTWEQQALDSIKDDLAGCDPGLQPRRQPRHMHAILGNVLHQCDIRTQFGPGHSLNIARVRGVTSAAPGQTAPPTGRWAGVTLTGARSAPEAGTQAHPAPAVR